MYCIQRFGEQETSKRDITTNKIVNDILTYQITFSTIPFRKKVNGESKTKQN